MKKFFSCVILFVCVFASMCLIHITSVFSVLLISYVYEVHRNFFWIVIIFGGTFGLGIVSFITYQGAILSVHLSQKIACSKNAGRYYAIGGFIILFYVVNLLSVLITRNGNDGEIVYSIFDILLGICIVLIGKYFIKEDANSSSDFISTDDTAFCRFCGKSLIGNAGRFCRFCGNEIDDKDALQNNRISFVENCADSDTRITGCVGKNNQGMSDIRNRDLAEKEERIHEENDKNAMNIQQLGDKLREYKKLLDEGLIDNEDYELKKKNMLEKM